MPMDRKRYPKDWEAIALSVKRRAGWKCEECGRPCRQPGEELPTFLERVAPVTVNQTLDNTWGIQDDDGHLKLGRFILTVAHLDHDPENPNARLAALCAPCHCRYDLKQIERKRQLMRERAGQLSLFSGAVGGGDG